MSHRVLIVIPARGGSKGIPRKNLRPLAGKPLLWYSVSAALRAGQGWTVAVSTEDAEIALMAERFGAEVVARPAHLSGDDVTLDPVIVDAVAQMERKHGGRYDVVVTVQPTSPLLEAAEIRDSVARLLQTGVETVLSVVDDRHLRWRRGPDGRAVPEYAARVNRQQLPAAYRETGAVVSCKRAVLERGSRIGASIELAEVAAEKAVDVDSFSDLALCEHLLTRRTVVFVIAGNRTIGLGHAYRGLVIAHELVQHHVEFLCPAGHELAAEVIGSRFYPVSVVPRERLLDEIARRRPHLVINDILDTEADFIRAQRALGARVVNFEDLGSGVDQADLVINALYPKKLPDSHVLAGPEYFCLRDEFLYLQEHPPPREPMMLATFGGVDEGNLTCRVLRIWQRLGAANGVKLCVVLGAGYMHQADLDLLRPSLDPQRVEVVPATTRISDYMARATAAITSGGRTVLELAALTVPTIVVCQNTRETTHTFAGSHHGVINLGHRDEVTDADIGEAMRRVLTDPALRAEMIQRAGAVDLRQGKARVIARINQLLQPGPEARTS
jgi:CMP-N-acetylneuraminic acid synthetase/spore coat polysaccharide biosynthesis predicted glycosyltransferase SpsG